jgi:uncharacterized phage-associated protein
MQGQSLSSLGLQTKEWKEAAGNQLLLRMLVTKSIDSAEGSSVMATAFDVAAYILGKKGTMTAMKLQKLLYYAQAWALVWDEKPLYDNTIQAWANGPVVPGVYNWHRGKYTVSPEDFNKVGQPETLGEDQRSTIDAVLNFYGDRSAQWLIDLTHSEEPWKLARKGLAPGERGNNVITHDSMADYYSSLT